MATIVRDTHSDQYHIRFRFAGRSFKRSLKTDREAHAAASLARLTETISLVRRGVLELPPDVEAERILRRIFRTRYSTLVTAALVHLILDVLKEIRREPRFEAD